MGGIVTSILETASVRNGNRIAVTFEDRSISYRELDSLANRIARTLLAAGTGRGDRVGIFLDKSIESVACLFGIMKCGAVCVPLDPTGPVERIAYIVADCGIRQLITSAGKKRKLAEILALSPPLGAVVAVGAGPIDIDAGAAAAVTWEAVLAQSDAALPAAAIDTDLAYILYTSGSTGTPKGVMITHRNVLCFVDWACDYFGLTEDDRCSCHAPFHFDITLFDLYATMRRGGTVCLVPQEISFLGVDLLRFIVDNRITVWQSVPSVLTIIAKQITDPGIDLGNLRVIFFSGEVFLPEALRDLMAKIPSARYVNIYGSTEMNDVTCFPVDTPPAGPVLPIGKSCSHMEVFALDDEGMPITKPGAVGELYARGGTLSAGYWGDPAMTAARFVQNPLHNRFQDMVYRSGDLVELDADGNYLYVGRRDAQVKIRGFRINLNEVEEALSRHPAVEQIAVIDLEDESRQRFLKAFVVPAEGTTLAYNDLKRHCLDKLPKYMVPEQLELCAMLPKTSTGKIDRRQLRQAAGSAQS